LNWCSDHLAHHESGAPLLISRREIEKPTDALGKRILKRCSGKYRYTRLLKEWRRAICFLRRPQPNWNSIVKRQTVPWPQGQAKKIEEAFEFVKGLRISRGEFSPANGGLNKKCQQDDEPNRRGGCIHGIGAGSSTIIKPGGSRPRWTKASDSKHDDEAQSGKDPPKSCGMTGSIAHFLMPRHRAANRRRSNTGDQL